MFRESLTFTKDFRRFGDSISRMFGTMGAAGLDIEGREIHCFH